MVILSKSYRHLNNIKSVCPQCLKIIEADVIEKDGKVIISKVCPEHGKFECLHIWDDPWCYEKINKLFENERTYPNGILIDLTLRCNMNCPFCFSSDTDNQNLDFKEPTIDDIIDDVNKFKKIVPFSTVFLFGGEPTMRDDIFEIISRLKELVPDVCLFTNGLKLSDEDYVHKLKNSGIDYVVLQLDSLDVEKNEKIRGENFLDEKLSAVSNLDKYDISVDLFTVIMKDINEDDIGGIILFASKNSKIINNIYLSTITHEGRGENTNIFKQVTNAERLGIIEHKFGIKKDDFLESTVFDHYLSRFFSKLTGTHCKHLAVCDMMCYMYSLDDDIVVSLNQLLNLKNITSFLEESIEILDSKKSFKRFRILYNFLKTISCNEMFIDMNIVPSFLLSSIHSLGPLLRNKPIKNNFNNIFRLIVTQFQDRYNIDFDTFRNCNLWAKLPNGEINSFCKKNILCRYTK